MLELVLVDPWMLSPLISGERQNPGGVLLPPHSYLSLFGGQGGIGNTLIGLFVLGSLNNGLDHVRIDGLLKILIRGLILLIVLINNVYAQRFACRAHQ